MEKRRVVVTGIGLVSCIGNNVAIVTESLRGMRSGIRFNPSYAEYGLRSQVSGSVQDKEELLASVDRKLTRFMGDAALFAHISMEQAIADSGLGEEVISHFTARLFLSRRRTRKPAYDFRKNC